jgi:hypothetical protein
MPCRDPDYLLPSEQEAINASRKKEEKKLAFLEAALCAALRGLECESGDEMYLHIDFKEAGIEQKELMDWYKVHKKKDAERLKREKEKEQRLKKSALEKVNKLLTSEERKILGLK